MCLLAGQCHYSCGVLSHRLIGSEEPSKVAYTSGPVNLISLVGAAGGGVIGLSREATAIILLNGYEMPVKLPSKCFLPMLTD